MPRPGEATGPTGGNSVMDTECQLDLSSLGAVAVEMVVAGLPIMVETKELVVDDLLEAMVEADRLTNLVPVLEVVTVDSSGSRSLILAVFSEDSKSHLCLLSEDSKSPLCLLLESPNPVMEPLVVDSPSHNWT